MKKKKKKVFRKISKKEKKEIMDFYDKKLGEFLKENIGKLRIKIIK